MTIPVPTGRFAIGPAIEDHGIGLSLVLPTFQEAANISDALRKVARVLRGIEGLRFEIIVVDDDSPDKTWQLAERQSDDFPEVRVMRRVGEKGLATAVIRGWQAARGSVLAVMDADGQHPAEVLTRLVAEIQKGGDLAIGSRHVEEGGVSDWSLVRRAISRTAQLIGLILLPEVVGRISDPMSGFFLVRRSAIASKYLNPTGYKILIEVLARGNIQTISEIGYVFQERRQGSSKVSTAIYLQYFEHLLRLRFVLLRASRFVRFGIVGLSGVVVDMLLLYLLSDPSMLGWRLTRSKIIAAELAIVNNFLWNDAWTFGDLVGPQDSPRGKLRRFIKFNAICFIGLILNVAVLNVEFNWFGVNRYVANAVAILIATFWNYSVNKRFGWRSTGT